MSYGGGSRALKLLWAHGLLQHLLPPVAHYLQEGSSAPAAGPDAMFDLLALVDQSASLSQAVRPELWVAMLAGPLAARLRRQQTSAQPMSWPDAVRSALTQLTVSSQDGPAHSVIPRIAGERALRLLLRWGRGEGTGAIIM